MVSLQRKGGNIDREVKKIEGAGKKKKKYDKKNWDPIVIKWGNSDCETHKD